MEVSEEELLREVLSGVNCDDRKSPKRNSAEGNCPKRNGLGVNYYEELSGEELSHNRINDSDLRLRWIVQRLLNYLDRQHAVF